MKMWKKDQEEDGYPPHWLIQIGKLCSRTILFFVGVMRVRVLDKDWIGSMDGLVQEVDRDGQGEDTDCLLHVSNHVSYLDILVHMYLSFPSFLARMETKHTPLVGDVADVMGCLYVQRAGFDIDEKQEGIVKTSNGTRTTEKIREEISKRRSRKEGMIRPLMIFPEGTTSNGEQLLTFRTGAFRTMDWIRPHVLFYRPLFWSNLSPSWESLSAIQHVILLSCQGGYEVTIHRLPPCRPSKERIDMKPEEYADIVRREMSHACHLKLVDSDWTDKKAYHRYLKDRRHADGSS